MNSSNTIFSVRHGLRFCLHLLLVYVVFFSHNSNGTIINSKDCCHESKILRDITNESLVQYGVSDQVKNILSEFSGKNSIKILLEINPDLSVLNWIEQNDFTAPIQLNKRFKRFPALFIRSDEVDVLDMGDMYIRNYKGVYSIHPGLPETRSAIHPDYEQVLLDGRKAATLKYIVKSMSRHYAEFLFNVLLPNGMYVYPLKGFEQEVWYDSYLSVLAQNVLEHNWVITDSYPQVYAIKYFNGMVLHKGFTLHGIYDLKGNPVGNIHMAQLKAKLNNTKSLLFDSPHDEDSLRNNWLLKGIRIGMWTNVLIFNENGRVYIIPKNDSKLQKKYYTCIGAKVQELYPDHIYEPIRKDGVVQVPDKSSTNLGGHPWIIPENGNAARPTFEQRNYLKEETNEFSYGAYNVESYRNARIYKENHCERLLSDFEINADDIPLISQKSGILPFHVNKFKQLALDNEMTIGIRNSNIDALPWIEKLFNNENVRPKPMSVKAKSIKGNSYSDFAQVCCDNKEYLDFGIYSRLQMGPGYVSNNDGNSEVCDICKDFAGLASIDPRTKRGRDAYDPENLSMDATCANGAEILYANGLVKKLFEFSNEGTKPLYYIFPIPFFANKYIEPVSFENLRQFVINDKFSFENITSGNLSGRFLTFNNCYIDQFNRKIKLLVLSGGITGTPSKSELVTFFSNEANKSTISVCGIYNYKGTNIKVFLRLLSDCIPNSTTYPTAYAIDQINNECGAEYIIPKWLPNKRISLVNSNTSFVNFGITDLAKVGGTIERSASLYNQVDFEENWVKGYYQLILNFIIADGLSPCLVETPCYVTKDMEGNAYFSDYDIHFYSYSKYHSDLAKRGTSWFPVISSNVAETRKYYQLINAYIMHGYPLQEGSPIKRAFSSYNIQTVNARIKNPDLITNELEFDKAMYSYSLIQHGPHDNWELRNYFPVASVNAGPQSDITIFAYTKSVSGFARTKVYNLSGDSYSYDQEKICKCLGINWSSVYPSQMYNRAPGILGHSEEHEYSNQYKDNLTTTTSQYNIYPRDIAKRSNAGVKWKPNAANAPTDGKAYYKMITYLKNHLTQGKDAAIQSAGQEYRALPCNLSINERMEQIKNFSDKDSAVTTENKQVRIWPNPTSDQLHIYCAANETMHVSLTNVQGVEIIRTKINDGKLDISNVPKGIYVLNVIVDSKNYFHKIVKY